jgi:hypothetical protein
MRLLHRARADGARKRFQNEKDEQDAREQANLMRCTMKADRTLKRALWTHGVMLQHFRPLRNEGLRQSLRVNSVDVMVDEASLRFRNS